MNVVAGARDWCADFLEELLEPAALAWSHEVHDEIAAGVTDTRFGALISLASRHTKRRRAQPGVERLAAARELLDGWNPEYWMALDVLRVSLVLARHDLESQTAVSAIQGAFQYGDVGELCALYRALALLPQPEAWVWQAGEGCRSNMTEVFEAVACDTPFPAAHFDDVAWRSLVVKAVFVGAPLWRVSGLDQRLSEDLARAALDLADERRSAGRPVQPELWLCLGSHGGERALASIERELSAGPALGRRAAALALARAGQADRLPNLTQSESDPVVLETIERALAGRSNQNEFQSLALVP